MIKRTGKSAEEHYKEAHDKIKKALEAGMKMIEADAKLLVGVNISAPYYGNIV